MRHSIILAAAAAFALTAAGAHAEERLSTKGLNLSVAADAKVFYDRLGKAAADACGGAPTYHLGSQEDAFQTCFKATLADAVAKSRAPLVAALHNKAPSVQVAAAH
jgi:UrcA family protein